MLNVKHIYLIFISLKNNKNINTAVFTKRKITFHVSAK